MDLAGLAAQCGVTPNGEEIETTCYKCDGPAVLWIGLEGEPKAHCIKCRRLDPETVIEALETAFKARQSAAKPKPDRPSKIFAPKLPAPGPALPAPYSVADDILRRVPPHSEEAEKSVLGAILINNELMAEVAGLPAEAFYAERHRILYRAFADLRSTATPIDPVTIGELLKGDGHLEMIGGYPYLAELATFTPAPSAIKHYAQVVTDMAYKRTVAMRASELAAHAYNGVSADALAGELERILKPVTQGEQLDRRPALLTFEDSRRLAEEAGSRPHIIQDLLTVEDISGLAAKKGIGKSTLLRTAAVGVSQERDVLGLRTNFTKVWYLDLEPGSQQARHEAFEALGWQKGDPNLILTACPPVAGQPWAFEWLEEQIEKHQFGLVIIDTLFKFCRIDQGNDYSSGLYGSAPLEGIVKRTKCHILIAHHAPKNGNPNNPNASAADLFLGAVSIAGSFGVCLAMRRNRGNVSLFMDAPRYTRQVIEGEWMLNKDAITREITLGQSVKRHWLDQAIADITYAAGKLTQPFKLADLEVDTLKKKEIWRVVKSMVEHQQIVEVGPAKTRGNPMLYKLPTNDIVPAHQPEQQSLYRRQNDG